MPPLHGKRCVRDGRTLQKCTDFVRHPAKSGCRKFSIYYQVKQWYNNILKQKAYV